LNLNANPSVEQLRNLLARCDDRAGHHVLRVTRVGEVELTRLPRTYPPPEVPNPPDVQLYYETFPAGKEYVGPEAAADEEWLSDLFASLEKEWRERRGKPDVACIDLERVHVSRA
jgi:hypothetical protein